MDDDIILSGAYDPFKDMMQEMQDDLDAETRKITIHVVKRKARKYITSVQGLHYHDINIPDFLKTMRKKCSCNGNLDKESNTVKFQGDQKDKLIQILVRDFSISEDMINLRGL